MQTDVDVLVVGAGACGLVAAIAAHDAGVGVAIIEKLDRPGGNSSLSTGSVPAAGTRFQREAGIADSTEQFVADLLRTGGPTDCPDLLRSLVDVPRLPVIISRIENVPMPYRLIVTRVSLHVGDDHAE